jgi:hypothetical protein
MSHGLGTLPAPIKIFFFVLMAISFAPPFLFGYNGAPFWTTILWSVVIAVETVGGGWRAPNKGIAGSFLIGCGFAAIWCIPTFFIGKIL